ncbi:MAG: ThiF family adenylyltransferase [Thermoplasmata archaeon]|nr:ThiF family adenylyltransferase [Thermoplasmata archaeon]
MPVNDRYSRHILLKTIRKQGQERLTKSRVVIIGCGALGTTITNNLVRSGVGFVRIADRDIVELSNLQRQMLFDEDDIGSPKAIAAVRKLEKINSEVIIEPVVDDVTYRNIEDIIKTMDVVIDGTDNMLIRFLMNDACVKHTIPWVYGGAIETYGMTMNIIPTKSPCFRCLVPDIPGIGELPTCDTVGVLTTIPTIIGSLQSTEVLKILLRKKDVNKNLITYDVWNHSFESIQIKKNPHCECCGKHHYEFLKGKLKEDIISLCEKGAIQISPVKKTTVSFDELEKKLRNVGEIENRKIILRCKIRNYELNIFQNGRAIIIGTNDKKIAKSLYAKYIGF